MLSPLTQSSGFMVINPLQDFCSAFNPDIKVWQFPSVSNKLKLKPLIESGFRVCIVQRGRFLCFGNQHEYKLNTNDIILLPADKTYIFQTIGLHTYNSILSFDVGFTDQHVFERLAQGVPFEFVITASKMPPRLKSAIARVLPNTKSNIPVYETSSEIVSRILQYGQIAYKAF